MVVPSNQVSRVPVQPVVFKTLADTNLRFLGGDFPKEGGKMQVGKGFFLGGFHDERLGTQNW